MSLIPDSHLDLLDKPAFAHVATLMKDGSPQVTPVWIDREGDLVVINSAAGRVKDKNLRRDGRVAFSITDPSNPYRMLAVRGKVVEITTEGAEQHIDALAKKYMGVDSYPFRTPDEVRVRYVIKPTSVNVFG
ncbi:MAG: PPOX class F420-dependent oxidoreductase [Myxococcales bacterium]|nr:PPOX class F420-dependent oxidoreductase [Myxococcales bacterium]MCB9630111.1 PPOX class F420-dependent oxidoreductase [Sandaracinaceae bacterium]